jgi:hypothetical protein
MSAPGSNSTFLTPGGPYFVSPSGTIQRQSNPIAAEVLNSTGWTGFPTDAAAKAFASSLDFNPATAAGKAAAAGIKSILPTGWENWVLRIGEIILGIMLIGIGVAKLTGAENAISKAVTIGALA